MCVCVHNDVTLHQLAFVDVMLNKPAFPHALGADVFRETAQLANLSALADSALASPREFFQILSVFEPALASFPVSSPAFSVAVDALTAVGKTMVQKVCVCVWVCMCVCVWVCMYVCVCVCVCRMW